MPTLAQTAADMLDAEMPLRDCVQAIRKAVVEEALKRSCGNQCIAAKILGIHRNTIRHELEEMDINHRPHVAKRLLRANRARLAAHDVQEMRA